MLKFVPRCNLLVFILVDIDLQHHVSAVFPVLGWGSSACIPVDVNLFLASWNLRIRFSFRSDSICSNAASRFFLNSFSKRLSLRCWRWWPLILFSRPFVLNFHRCWWRPNFWTLGQRLLPGYTFLVLQFLLVLWRGQCLRCISPNSIPFRRWKASHPQKFPSDQGLGKHWWLVNLHCHWVLLWQ